MEFARFSGLTFPARATHIEIVDAVCATAAHVHVDLVLVDELHNLNLGSRAGAEASDQLKYFAERLPATFAYAGIDIEGQGLFAGTRGRQIAGRFVVVPADPFSYATTADKEAWRGLIGTLESVLRLHEHAPGTLTAMSDYLFHRTGGMIGSLSQLIRGAAVLAIEDGSEAITEELLEIVPIDFAAEQSEQLTAPAKATGRRRRAAQCSCARCPTRFRPLGTRSPRPTSVAWPPCTAWTSTACGCRSPSPPIPGPAAAGSSPNGSPR
ncbi:hypothetical protein [Streptomyces sp. NPDC055036]